MKNINMNTNNWIWYGKHVNVDVVTFAPSLLPPPRRSIRRKNPSPAGESRGLPRSSSHPAKLQCGNSVRVKGHFCPAPWSTRRTSHWGSNMEKVSVGVKWVLYVSTWRDDWGSWTELRKWRWKRKMKGGRSFLVTGLNCFLFFTCKPIVECWRRRRRRACRILLLWSSVGLVKHFALLI